MLQLKNISKDYVGGNMTVHALKGIDVSFRESEFVSVLGPSGCGKTTLLNIIGGLDRYTDGDLVINAASTKTYTDRDWDTYRNHSIGFVFQSYNLIPHQTVLENVELTMTLGGVAKAERKKRALDALTSVGLKDLINKKPNQLSGGQMQRVSIARAIVGDPDIILADEPTGALDSETSETVMEILKEISKTRLVIMVTHNPDLAKRYSDRIIKMLDGKITEDSRPYTEEAAKESPAAQTTNEINYKKKHSSMSFWTALKLSAKNLLSKAKRTIITSVAASIGIIGVAVILSVSSGMQTYIDTAMLDGASANYISISSSATSIDFGMMAGGSSQSSNLTEFPSDTTGIYPYEPKKAEVVKQKLDGEFVSYLEENTKALTVDITYSYNVDLNILTKNGDEYIAISSSNWKECLNNKEYLAERYTLLASDGATQTGIPSAKEEVALVVDSYNRLSTDILDSLGIEYNESLDEIKYSELIGKQFRVIFNDGWYTQNADGWYIPANTANYKEAYENENGITVKIISVLRINEDATSSWLSNGIAYSSELTKAALESNKTSAVATAQAANETIDVTTGAKFSSSSGGWGDFGGGMGGISLIGGKTYESALEKLGYTQTPSSITIYPVDVNSKDKIIEILDNWNAEKEGTDSVITYTDIAGLMTSMLGTIVNIITYVLMAFSIVSLIISSVMIAIIIYASVIERTKEIGVLRSIGARKKDISRVFKAEATLLGVASGVIAILITLPINAIINAILGNLAGVSTIASLSVFTAVGLIALSAILLLIAGLIPAKMAAKKEPAVALRTE